MGDVFILQWGGGVTVGVFRVKRGLLLIVHISHLPITEKVILRYVKRIYAD